MSSLTPASCVPDLDRQWLDRAAAMAVRGFGRVAPNPLVGCIVLDADGAMAGSGLHRRCGDDHAEVEAIHDAGNCAAGGTMYVTLEPCNHTGRTPPCTQAIVAAGISRVVIGTNDPNAESGDGIGALRAAGVEVEVIDHQPSADVSAPFRYRLETGLPWLIAKWAQTVDGAIATRTGDSQWISSPASRAVVHRHRGRVDAILTGIGTAMADDPQLTARNVRLRTVARRIVIDPSLRLPLDSNLIATIGQAPLTLVCLDASGDSRHAELEAAGVEVVSYPGQSGRLVLRDVLGDLAKQHVLSHVLVESGPGLMYSLLKEDLVRELAVFIAPMLLGDGQALPPLDGLSPLRMIQARHIELHATHRRGDDVLLRYWIEAIGSPNASADNGR